MDEETPHPPQDQPPDSEPEYQDQREIRRADRRGAGGWVGGAVLVILGLVFLLRNTGVFELENWWALFILIPALGSFATARSNYQNSGGRFTAAVRGPLIGGFILLMVSAAFLFSLDFGLLWPVFLILGGIALLFNALGGS